jgi:hypothetical protein
MQTPWQVHESKQSSSDSKFDTENELDDHAFLNRARNDGSDEEYNSTQDFFWENMQTRKGKEASV